MRRNGYAPQSDCQRGAIVMRDNPLAAVDFGGGDLAGSAVLGGVASLGGNVFCQGGGAGTTLNHVWNVTDCPCATMPGCSCLLGPTTGGCGPSCPLQGSCCATGADGVCDGSAGGGASVGIGVLGGAANVFDPLPTSATVIDRAPLQTRVENVTPDGACSTIVVEACECRSQPDGAPCDDGNPCTRVDTCSRRACVGTVPVVCAAVDACHEAGVCDASTGTCSHPSRPDGSACGSGTCYACVSGTCIDRDGADADRDSVCMPADNCPGEANPDQRDLDGDGAGDDCDGVDGPISIRRVLVRSDPRPGADRSRIMVQATVAAHSPLDDLVGSARLSVAVTDGRATTRTYEWSGADCATTAAGAVLCTSADARSQARLVPRRSSPGRYLVRIRLRRVAIRDSVTAPLTLGLRYAALDWVVTAASCRSSARTLHCGPRNAR